VAAREDPAARAPPNPVPARRPEGRDARFDAVAPARPFTAASQRFERLHRCFHVRMWQPLLPDYAKRLTALASALPATTPWEARQRREETAALTFNTDYVARAQDDCDDAGDYSVVALSAASLQAANLGDSRAAECYIVKPVVVLPPPDVIPQRALSTQEKAAHAVYVANARRLIANGLARGDWRMVAQAMSSANDRAFDGIDDRRDPTLEYRMVRLLQRGLTEPRDRDSMQRMADAMREHLTEAQAKGADAWVARQAPRFARTPLLDYGLMCALPGYPNFRPD
jgi:hypothetical protein